MPNVAGREFPYTPQGMAAAEQYKQSLGMRGGGMMGFRPVGYQDGTGPAGVSPAFQRYKDETRGLSDIELAERVAYEDVLRSFRTPEKRQYTFSSKELMDAGYGPRMRTRVRAIPELEEYLRRKDSAEDPKTSLIRKHYFEALKNITDKLPTQSPEMQRNIDKGMAEAYPGGYSKPMLSPYEGTYELPEDPDIPWTTETRDLYRGGGYPGPSFIPSGDQTAPDFEQPPASGMRNGGMMGFRPVGYRDGDLVEDPAEEAMRIEPLPWQDPTHPPSSHAKYYPYEEPDPSLIPLREPGTGIPQKVAPPRSLDLGDPVPSEFLFGTGAGVGLGAAGPVMGGPLPDALVPPGIRDALETPPRVNTEVEDLSAREPMTFSAQNNFRVVSETAETLKGLIKSFEGYAEPIKEATNAAIASGIREDLVLAALQFLGGEGTQIPTSPIMSPGAKGVYGINPALINPANQGQMDAYYGGVPGPSFSPGRGQTAPDFRNYMDTGSFRGVTYGDPYFDDQLLPGGGEVPRGMRHGGIMSLRRR